MTRTSCSSMMSTTADEEEEEKKRRMTHNNQLYPSTTAAAPAGQATSRGNYDRRVTIGFDDGENNGNTTINMLQVCLPFLFS